MLNGYRSFLIVVSIPLMFALTSPPSIAAQTAGVARRERLTVDDVIKLLQVKLSEDLLIDQIRKNNIAFSLSADELVRLKNNGATDNVIRVMLDPISPVNSGGASPSSSVLNASKKLPEVFGFYGDDGHALTPLPPASITTTFGLMVGADRGFAVDGIAQTEQRSRFEKSPVFTAYEQGLIATRLQLSVLSLVSTMKAYQFNILNTAPQFFSNIYHKNPNESVDVNLLRPTRTVSLQIAPVDGRRDMFRLVPTTQLSPGKYALYDRDALHEGDHVFSASPGRRASAFLVEITGSTIEIAPPISASGKPCLPRPSNWNVMNAEQQKQWLETCTP